MNTRLGPTVGRQAQLLATVEHHTMAMTAGDMIVAGGFTRTETEAGSGRGGGRESLKDNWAIFSKIVKSFSTTKKYIYHLHTTHKNHVSFYTCGV